MNSDEYQLCDPKDSVKVMDFAKASFIAGEKAGLERGLRFAEWWFIEADKRDFDYNDIPMEVEEAFRYWSENIEPKEGE